MKYISVSNFRKYIRFQVATRLSNLTLSLYNTIC